MDMAVIWLFLGIIIVGGAFLVLMAVTRRASKHLDTQKYRERWLSISNSMSSDSGTQELAIINADKLLDQAMRERGITGETMGDRLKQAKTIFQNNNAVWTAHKLRNRIAHEDSVRLNTIAVKQAMASYKAALKDLGAL